MSTWGPYYEHMRCTLGSWHGQIIRCTLGSWHGHIMRRSLRLWHEHMSCVLVHDMSISWGVHSADNMSTWLVLQLMKYACSEVYSRLMMWAHEVYTGYTSSKQEYMQCKLSLARFMNVHCNRTGNLQRALEEVTLLTLSTNYACVLHRLNRGLAIWFYASNQTATD